MYKKRFYKKKKSNSYNRVYKSSKVKTNRNFNNSQFESNFDYSNYFDFTSNGRIKGGYNSDGFFEPD